MLNWSSPTNRLTVVGMPQVIVRPIQPNVRIITWSALDARTPLEFLISPQGGDPAFLQLLIRPRLLSNVTEFANASGGSSSFQMQLMMAVSVNGQQVTRDSLYTQIDVGAGQELNYSLAFPKGNANNVVVPNVPSTSLVSVTMWGYLLADGTTTSYLQGTNSYGNGVAIEVDITDATAVAVDDEPAPTALALAARPNPSAGATRIEYTLPQARPVKLAVYDVAGHRVGTLVDGFQEAGRREAVWDGKRTNGERVSAGVYLMELMVGNERRVGKLVLTR